MIIEIYYSIEVHKMGSIKEVEYINHLRTIDSTSANPIICECSDGCHYYTKFYEGPEGPRELVN